MRALRAGYNRGMKGRPGYVTGLFDKVYTGTRPDMRIIRPTVRASTARPTAAG